MGEIFRIVAAEADRGRMMMRESSGINTDLLGVRGDDASGIAIARRQAQGQVIATGFFDNHRQFKRMVGQRLAKRIQQVYTYERTVRLVDEVGQAVFVTLNPLEARGQGRDEFRRLQEGMAPDLRPKVLRDVSSLDYDVIISETPTTPSMRMTSLLALLEIVSKVPMIVPAVIDIIIELTDLPDRARVLERVRALMQPQVGSGSAVTPTPPPGQPGVGTPPGAPPGPTPPLAVRTGPMGRPQ